MVIGLPLVMADFDGKYIGGNQLDQFLSIESKRYAGQIQVRQIQVNTQSVRRNGPQKLVKLLGPLE